MTDRTVTAAFRFGFGLPLADDAATPEALLQGLAGPDTAAARWQGVTTADALAVVQAERLARAALTEDPENMDLKKAQRQALRDGLALQRRGQRAMFARALDGAPLRERLALFWANHFSVSVKGRTQRPWPSTLREEAIRPHLTAPFATLLTAVALHPAMLIYLDQASSIGPGSKRGKAAGKGLNENYARELLELHTLGVGAAYSQADVRELAELLTGMTFRPEAGYAFDPARAEPGPETVLGETYAGRGEAPIRQILQDLAVRPETARHLARKLAVHFIAPDPDPALVDALAAVWQKTGGDLGQVTAALLRHPLAGAPEAAKVRAPVEFVIGALHALGMTADEVYRMADSAFQRLIIDRLTAMGQTWEEAPGPNGWPEAEEAWITPAGMAARIEWALQVPGRLVVPLPDPRAFAARALGERAGERVVRAASAAESLREGVGLVLASPEFNRR